MIAFVCLMFVFQLDQKEQKVIQNREEQMKALRDKLKAKEEHAQKVRDAKKQAQAQEPAS